MESPPNSTDARLSEYLVRQLVRIELAMSLNTVQKLTILPTKPVVGKMYYFMNAILPTITTEGIWVYKSTGWTLLG